MKSVSDRLAQEDRILREIRLALSAVSTSSSPRGSRKRGTIYASSPITSGRALYDCMERNGFISASEFRTAMPEEFLYKVLAHNLKSGRGFGKHLEDLGWPNVIVPGQFFANGWTQEHYMSLWRQVIARHARTVALGPEWTWSLGCTEEFIIAIQHQKQVLDYYGQPLVYEDALHCIRKTMDRIDRKGFDIKPHYDLWRLGTLTVESIRQEAHGPVKTS